MRIGRIGVVLLIGFVLFVACGEDDLVFPGSSADATNTPGAGATSTPRTTTTPTPTPT